LLNLHEHSFDEVLHLLAETNQQSDCSVIADLGLALHEFVDSLHLASHFYNFASEFKHFLFESVDFLARISFFPYLHELAGGLNNRALDSRDKARDVLLPDLEFLLLDVPVNDLLLELLVLLQQ
jgi:hypothetical protein